MRYYLIMQETINLHCEENDNFDNLLGKRLCWTSSEVNLLCYNFNKIALHHRCFSTGVHALMHLR